MRRRAFLAAGLAAFLGPDVHALAYPTRGALWGGCSSWRHFTASYHRGKFDLDWLRTLSWWELQALHSDDHERRVRWAEVYRPGLWLPPAAAEPEPPAPIYRPPPRLPGYGIGLGGAGVEI